MSQTIVILHGGLAVLGAVAAGVVAHLAAALAAAGFRVVDQAAVGSVNRLVHTPHIAWYNKANDSVR